MNHVAQTTRGFIEYRTVGPGPTLLVLNGDTRTVTLRWDMSSSFWIRDITCSFPHDRGTGKPPLPLEERLRHLPMPSSVCWICSTSIL